MQQFVKQNSSRIKKSANIHNSSCILCSYVGGLFSMSKKVEIKNNNEKYYG